jgi:hypothetical protein
MTLYEICENILSVILPPLAAVLANRRIARRILENDQDCRSHTYPNAQILDTKVLEEYLKAEQDRKKVIEDKAKAGIIAITFSLTLSTGGLALLPTQANAPSPVMGYVCAVIMAFSIGYLLLGGFSALRALNIRKVYLIDLATRARLKRHAAGAEAEGDADAQALEDENTLLVYVIDQNQHMNRIASNLADAALAPIRNGLTLTGFFIMLSFWITAEARVGGPSASTPDVKAVLVAAEATARRNAEALEGIRIALEHLEAHTGTLQRLIPSINASQPEEAARRPLGQDRRAGSDRKLPRGGAQATRQGRTH